MKLYRVTLRGMTTTVANTTTAYGCPYVVANDSTEAINKVQKYLYDKGLGCANERELDKIELLAEEGDYPNCNIQLFL